MPEASNQSAQAGSVPPPSTSQLGGSEDLHPLLQKLLDNIKVIGAVVGVVILAVVGLSIYEAMQNKALTEASNTFGVIQLQNQGLEEYKALEAFYPEAPESLKNAVLFEMAAAATAAEEHDAAAKTWELLAGRLEGPNAVVAKLGRVKSLSASGRDSEALVILQSLSTSAPEPFQAEVMRTLASVAERADNTAAAIQGYQWLIDNAGAQDKSYFEYKVAQLKEAE